MTNDGYIGDEWNVTTGLIIGVVIAAIASLGVLTLTYVCHKRQKKSINPNPTDSSGKVRKSTAVEMSVP